MKWHRLCDCHFEKNSQPNLLIKAQIEGKCIALSMRRVDNVHRQGGMVKSRKA